VYATDPHTVNDVITSMKKLSGVLERTMRALGSMKSWKAGSRVPRKTEWSFGETRVVCSLDGAIDFQSGEKLSLRTCWSSGATSVVESKQDWPQFSLEERCDCSRSILCSRRVTEL